MIVMSGVSIEQIATAGFRRVCSEFIGGSLQELNS